MGIVKLSGVLSPFFSAGLIYTHVLNRGLGAVLSPADRLLGPYGS